MESNRDHIKKELTDDERRNLLDFLLANSDNGVLKRGAKITASTKFSISTKTVQRIWKRAQASAEDGEVYNVSSRKPGRVGRKRVEIDFSQVLCVPLNKRGTIRSLANSMKVPHATLYRRYKEGFIRAHTSATKPDLTDEQKEKRLQFCFSMIDPVSTPDDPYFKDMLNYVHIDEKWFFFSKTSQRYYMLPGERDPYRTCKSKRYIPKIMFLAAVARPRMDMIRQEEFSGKIGIFPLVYKEPAKRKSKNREAGTMETKPILSITRDVIRECLINKVLPAIKEKWPVDGPRKIFIQQDNARTHIDSNDPAFIHAASGDCFDIELCSQPANSPDMNVLDLGFFRAIQSLQQQEAPKSIDELITSVEHAFDGLSSASLNKTFVSLQTCMIEVMKCHGGNDYKVPHIGKSRMERDNAIPLQIHVDPNLVYRDNIDLT